MPVVSLGEMFLAFTVCSVCVSCLGASEMLMANAVSQLAAKTPGKEAIAMEAFAKALRMVNFFSLLLFTENLSISVAVTKYFW